MTKGRGHRPRPFASKFHWSLLLDRVFALDHALVAALAAITAAGWLALRLAVGALRDLHHQLLQIVRQRAHLVLVLLSDRVAQILDQLLGATLLNRVDLVA